MEKVRQDQIIHLPDLSFARYCLQAYNINRGIYNTIDAWFYNNGIKEIVQRRDTILSFLSYIQKLNAVNEKGKINFGSGGLTLHLVNFSRKNKLNVNIS